MDAPFEPGIIYQTPPYHTPNRTPSPAPVLPRQAAPSAHMLGTSQVTGTGTAHGPTAWHYMPAPNGYYPAPAYFILPYSYAYAPVVLSSPMSHLHAIPLLSRIQLNHSPSSGVPPGRPGVQHGRGRQVRRAADTAEQTGKARRYAPGGPGRDRSASPASHEDDVPRRGWARSTRRQTGGADTLLARLSSPLRPSACLPLADRLSDSYADTRSTTARRVRPLASRLSSPDRSRAHTQSPPPVMPPRRPRAAPSPLPAPLDSVPRTPYVWDAPDRVVNALRPQPSILHAVKDDHGHRCLTSLPIRSGEEVLRYLSIPFEDEAATPAIRLPFETARGPDPPTHPPRLCAVPPSYVLLHEYWALLRLALWKRYGPHCISRITMREIDNISEEAHSPSEWNSALPPGKHARAVLGPDPARWTDSTLSDIGLSPASERESRDMVWENDTFLFRNDVERLASKLHKGPTTPLCGSLGPSPRQHSPHLGPRPHVFPGRVGGGLPGQRGQARASSPLARSRMARSTMAFAPAPAGTGASRNGGRC